MLSELCRVSGYGSLPPTLISCCFAAPSPKYLDSSQESLHSPMEFSPTHVTAGETRFNLSPGGAVRQQQQQPSASTAASSSITGCLGAGTTPDSSAKAVESKSDSGVAAMQDEKLPGVSGTGVSALFASSAVLAQTGATQSFTTSFGDWASESGLAD